MTFYHCLTKHIIRDGASLSNEDNEDNCLKGYLSEGVIVLIAFGPRFGHLELSTTINNSGKSHPF